jgi:hypothetical protein
MTCGSRERDAYGVSVNKPEGRRPLRRIRHRLEDNIKMDLKEVRWIMDWISLAQKGKVVGYCEHDSGPSCSIHCM